MPRNRDTPLGKVRMRGWLLLIAMMVGCGNKPVASQANSPSPQPVPKPAAVIPPKKVEATPVKKEDPTAVKPTVQAEEPAAKKSPCTAGQHYEKSTGRCITPTPESYSCVNETQVYDWNKRRCRLRSFREWCEAQDNPYEISLTVGKVLNTLGARDCNEAERRLATTKVLYFPPGGQKISNVTPLASLTHLTGLYIPDNHIVDIAPLSLLKNLQALSLRGNDIQDISPLMELPELKRLDVAGNPIADWSPLSHMKQLVRVSTTAPTPKPDAG